MYHGICEKYHGTCLKALPSKKYCGGTIVKECYWTYHGIFLQILWLFTQGNTMVMFYKYFEEYHGITIVHEA